MIRVMWEVLNGGMDLLWHSEGWLHGRKGLSPPEFSGVKPEGLK